MDFSFSSGWDFIEKISVTAQLNLAQAALNFYFYWKIKIYTPSQWFGKTTWLPGGLQNISFLKRFYIETSWETKLNGGLEQ